MKFSTFSAFFVDQAWMWEYAGFSEVGSPEMH
jgi:hypothetical protein